MNALPTINAFWVGPRLGRLHAACLQSFAKQGHHVVLHTYDPPPEDVPDGVDLSDADRLLSRDRVIRHQNSGSLALASDLFRYELMAVDAGIYVDCDCYCVKSLKNADFIFGKEDDAKLGTAVLKIPSDSTLLAAMRAIGTTSGFIPPWEKAKRRRRYRLRLGLGRPVPLSQMRWGTMGPTALTYYVNKLGFNDKAFPIDEFYPVYYRHVSLLRDRQIHLEDLITPRTKVVHLWNEKLLKAESDPAPPGSPLSMILESIGDDVGVGRNY